MCLLGVVLSSASSVAQSWITADKVDPFRGTHYTAIELDGKFLTPPQHENVEKPVLYLECVAGTHGYGRGVREGSFLSGHINMGTVLNRDPQRGGVPVQFRLDDGKIQQDLWSASTDGQTVFLNEMALDTLLYGHFLPHKEGTNPAVKKVTIAVNEYLASEVVAEFDIPEAVADTCGVIVHKKH